MTLDDLTNEEKAALHALLRPDERILCMERGGVSPAKKGFFSFLRPAPQPVRQGPLYVLSSARVLAFTPGEAPRTWPLMLGLVRDVVLREDGSGDVVFDYAADHSPVGVLQVPQAETFRRRLEDAVNEAYMAAPWSV